MGADESKEVSVLTTVLHKREQHVLNMSAQEEFDFLNKLYGKLVPPIHKYDGSVDLYIPEETRLTAVFGYYSLDSSEQYSLRAVRAALEMNDVIERLNEESDTGKVLDISIGVATGEAVLGNVGIPERLDYRAVGPAVNIALFLAREGKNFGNVLVNDVACEQARELLEPDTKEFVLSFGEREIYFSVLGGLRWTPLSRQ